MPTGKPAVPSVWARQRHKREQPPLSQDRIVAEAVRLLDEEGIEALSMRSLGTRLGAGATSLYRHVASKDELIELVVDEVYGEMEVPDGSGAPWRESVTACAGSLRAMILRHPWVASVLGQVGLAELGPNLTRQSERMLALFHRAGFPAGEADRAMSTVIAYVIGMTVSEAAYLSMLARSGQSEQELVEGLRRVAEETVRDLPLLREGYDQRAGEDPSRLRDEGFAYGLERFLDGLQVRLDALGSHR
ncbi:TetR/AcrR family transcriptional regulator [Nonomuraea roseoviolacea subsp. roseoviolacea]|uniref:TetR/AcrR family transcriptional regulator n=1 Tax=Nonomuraea roseoviolacea TaxID=103837 RepID=UPI0031DE0790